MWVFLIYFEFYVFVCTKKKSLGKMAYCWQDCCPVLLNETHWTFMDTLVSRSSENSNYVWDYVEESDQELCEFKCGGTVFKGIAVHNFQNMQEFTLDENSWQLCFQDPFILRFWNFLRTFMALQCTSSRKCALKIHSPGDSEGCLNYN